MKSSMQPSTGRSERLRFLRAGMAALVVLGALESAPNLPGGLAVGRFAANVVHAQSRLADVPAGTTPLYQLYKASTNRHFYLTDQKEKSLAQNRARYIYQGTVGNILTASPSGLTPVYRLIGPYWKYMWMSQDWLLQNKLQQPGWTFDGVTFFVNSSQVPGSLPLWSLVRAATHGRMLALGDNDKNNVVTGTKGAYQPEWIVGYAFPTQVQGTLPLYEITSLQEATHIYVVGDDQRKSVVASGHDFTYTGRIVGYVFPGMQGDAVPLYRTRTINTDAHFYTVDTGELYNVVHNFHYVMEGVLGYVYTDQVPGTTPLLRLGNSQTYDHFYTTSQSESDRAVNHFGFHVEGTVGYIWPVTAGELVASLYPLFRPTIKSFSSFYNDGSWGWLLWLDSVPVPPGDAAALDWQVVPDWRNADVPGGIIIDGISRHRGKCYHYESSNLSGSNEDDQCVWNGGDPDYVKYWLTGWVGDRHNLTTPKYWEIEYLPTKSQDNGNGGTVPTTTPTTWPAVLYRVGGTFSSYIPYVTKFPAVGTLYGTVTSITNPGPYTLSFPHLSSGSTDDCANADTADIVAPGQSVDLADVYGQAQPPISGYIPILACMGGDGPASVSVNVTYIHS